MKRIFGIMLLLILPVHSWAQVTPSPSLDDPRLQTLSYDPSRTTRLVAFPDTNLTVMLLPGEQIDRVSISDRNAFEVRITDANDSINIIPLRSDASATLVIDTRQRRYEFDVGTRGGLAAYLVRFLPDSAPPSLPRPVLPAPPLPEALSSTNQYRLSGERALRPTMMSDDGQRTYILWDAAQSLPAVFGIGPTGQEEVVDGYMRAGRFTIDRVYDELVFRMDKKLVKARRLKGRRAG